MSANETQIGGHHYKSEDAMKERATDLGYNKPIEHWDLVVIRGYGYLQGNASKYLDRFEKKGTPVQDLKKARHYIDKLIEIEEAKAARVAAEAEAADIASTTLKRPSRRKKA